MIENLCPYPEMRGTNLPWVPTIPVHWEIRRNGRLFGIRKETGFPELPVLEVSLRTGVRVRNFDDTTRKQQMADRSKYQRALQGNIAYNMMRMWQGAVGVVPTDGLVSPAYIVVRPYRDTNARYYMYLFRTATYMREVDTYSRGIVPDRNRLYWESFKQMPSLFPSPEEQSLIVRFLDANGILISRLIRAKQRLIGIGVGQKGIGLFHEFRDRLIADVVTGKLDVRAAAAALPEITESEPIDEPTDGEDLEEAIDDVENEAVAA